MKQSFLRVSLVSVRKEVDSEQSFVIPYGHRLRMKEVADVD